MIYHPSRDAVDSLMRLGERIAERARLDRQIKRDTRQREAKLLAEFNANKPKAEPVKRPTYMRKYVMSDEVRAQCDELRKTKTWDQISVILNHPKSTLVKHYTRWSPASKRQAA